MAWRPRSKPVTKVVTQKFAKEWSEMDEIRSDRPLSERRLAVYKRVLEAGEFRPVTWAKVYVTEMDQYYRVNGKHTSTVFANVDLTDKQEVIAVIEDYEADTVEDAVRLYSTFDSQSQVRNQSDINRMFAASIPELKDFEARLVNLCVGALNYWKSPGMTGPIDKENATSADKAEVLFDEIEFCTWVKAILPHRGTAYHMWRVPVVAAMRGTWGKSQKAATEFWTAVRDETGTKPDMPDRKLAKFLYQTTSSVGNTSKAPQRFRIQTREYYVKCIHAWNAWRKSETTNLNYYATAKIPSFS